MDLMLREPGTRRGEQGGHDERRSAARMMLAGPSVSPFTERGDGMDLDGDDLLPVGPGRRDRSAGCPPFDADPAAWFRWVDAALAAGRPNDEAARAASWADARGRVWRVVVTPDGPEVRPAFGAPFGATHDMPMVSAILVSPPLLHVELAWRTGQEVARLGCDEISVHDLGIAMLTATELPHESVARIGRETWDRAHQRWRELADGSRVVVS
jgi:hypothetical protein